MVHGEECITHSKCSVSDHLAITLAVTKVWQEAQTILTVPRKQLHIRNIILEPSLLGF